MIKQLLKKVLIIYLVVIACVFTPTYNAYAASAGGWSFSSFDVATSVVKAMKNGASASAAIAKSPITSKIAKGILGGAIAGAAIPLAISQISGIALTAVDWVLDPANNQIKYAPKGTAILPYSVVGSYYTGVGASPADACKDYVDYMVKLNHDAGYTWDSHAYVKATNTQCFMTYYADANSPSELIRGIAHDPNNDYKTIPIPTVADKIYDNAKTDTASASVVNDAVRGYVNEGSADVALDAAKADTDATHNCGTGTHWSGSACVADAPTTPSTPTTDTPFDPTDIIDAIGKVFDAVMSLPDVINNALDDLLVDIKDFFQPVIDSFTDFVDWVKAEPTPENPTKPDVTTLPTPPTDSVNISFGGGCPSPKIIPWSFAGRNIDITIPYTPICDTATLLNPLIKLAASLGAVFIIAGIRRGDDG